MFKNIGAVDRFVRIFLGLMLIALAIFAGFSLFAKALVAAIGTVLMATALARFCPLYRLVGMNSCRL